ncbi:MAG: hypothetical protein AB4290_01415 [Spirulina sp.]
MISYNDIQALIAEIDGVLPRHSERAETAPESLTEEDRIGADKQREVLEKVRWYLLDLRGQIETTPSDSPQLSGEEQETASAIADAVMAQLNVRRQDWLHPLQMEVEGLQQQRESLLQDIRALEGQHLQLMSDFLQILLGRCSTALQHELALCIEKFEDQLWQLQGEDYGTTALTPLKHLDRLQKLRSLQQQADILVLNLDRTFHKVFESLEGDMQSYQKSLSRGLEQMHELGRQGKAFLAAYLQRLNPEMAAGATSLEEDIGDLLLDRPLEEPSSLESEAIEDVQTGDIAMFPFAGMEIPPSPTPRGSAGEWELDEENEGLDAVDALFRVDLAPEVEGDDGLEAWEAWDEHLFHSDELMNEGEESSPIVLTLKETDLEPLSAEDAPVRALFDGLADPALTPEHPELLSPVSDTPSLPVEVELFGEPQEEAIAVPLEEVLPPDEEKKPPEKEVPEADSQTLDEIVGETIASLTELLDEKSERSESEEEVIEEEGISVAAGETLLATEEVKPQPQTDLGQLLDSGQLKTLSEDLVNFEGNRSVSEIDFSPAELEETREEAETETREAREEPSSPIEAIASSAPSPLGVEEEKEEEIASLTREEGEIHLDVPEIDAVMEVDESFEDAFEEEIISEEDEDWILSESAIAEDAETLSVPPFAIVSSLTDLHWEHLPVTSESVTRHQSPVTSQEPNNQQQITNNQQQITNNQQQITNNQQQELEIVVDDDVESLPSQPVLTGVGRGQNPVPVLRSPKTEETFSSHEDLWDNPEVPREESSPSQSVQPSNASENTERSVTEIVTDPWSEMPKSSEKQRNKRKP